ncbi:AAA family ATPase [Caballeronia sp. dw_276]|uniref:AAA family ATPase n=1 Tax=Caballeronia sp. dw_276 TaxID=2719795 RepID=UPI001BD6995D|nr:AAA family ATPase [Caballeronia sp. dw_276]
MSEHFNGVQKFISNVTLGKLTPTKYEYNDASAALKQCDPESTRPDWFEMVVGAVKGGVPDKEIEAWSKQAGSLHEHKPFWDAVDWAKKPYTGTGKRYTVGTLYFHAKKAGWTPSKWVSITGAALVDIGGVSILPKGTYTGHSGVIKGVDSPGPIPEPEKPSDLQIAKNEDLWKSYLSGVLVQSHPYAKKKNLAKTADIRFVPSGAGKHQNCLAAPFRNFDGRIITYQYIDSEGEKKNVYQDHFGTSFYCAGGIIPQPGNKRIIIVEGVAIAEALHTYFPNDFVIAVGGIGRFPTVAKAVREHCRRNPIFIAQDAGAGALKSAQDAAKVGASHLLWPDKYDKNMGLDDLGIEHALALMDKAVRVKRRYEGKTSASIRHEPPLEWLVSKVLPRTGQHSVIGRWSTGKTLWAMYLAHCVSEGEWFFGFRTKTCHVSHIFLEGQSGLPQRIQAFESHYGKPFSENVCFYRDRFDLRNADDIETLCDEIEADGGKDGLVIVDTLAAASRGAAENTSEGMGELLAGLVRIEERLGGCVLALHHPPEGNGPIRGRGHSSAPSGGDLIITIESETPDEKGEISAWKVPKLRDNKKRNEGFRYRIVGVPLGIDKDGEEISGAVLVPLDDEEKPAKGKPAKQPKAVPEGKETIAYDALKPLFAESHSTVSNAPNGELTLMFDECVKHVSPLMVHKGSKHQKQEAQRAIEQLVKTKIYSRAGNYIWVTQDD